MPLPFLKSIAGVAIFAQLFCGNVALGSTFHQEYATPHSNISSDDSAFHSQNSRHNESICQPGAKCLRSLSGVSIPKIQDGEGRDSDFFSTTLDGIIKIFSLEVAYSPPFVPSTLRMPRSLDSQSLVVLRL